MMDYVLFMIGFAVLGTPLLIMWLDGFFDPDSEDDGDMIQWLMSKPIEQMAMLQGCVLSGPLLMAVSIIKRLS